MTDTILRGERVTLRPPQPSDIADRLRLGRDPEITRMFGGSAADSTPLTANEIEQQHAALAASDTGWVIETDERAVGTARLHGLDAHDQRARYAVGIHDPELLGRGLGAEVTQLVLAHAFETMQLHRIDLRVLTYNTRAIRCYEKCGFRLEGVERESALVDGERFDDAMMAILRPDWLAAPPAAKD